MKTRSQGMTLLELMAAIAVLGILTAIAVPSFRQFTANSRTTAATNDLVTALNVARSEALRRATNVVVCASSDEASCSGSVNWANGWVAFADPNGNGTVDANEIIQVWRPTGGGLAVTANAASVGYNAMGMGALVGGVPVQFDFIAPGCTGDRAGRTVVLLAGTIRSTRVACP